MLLLGDVLALGWQPMKTWTLFWNQRQTHLLDIHRLRFNTQSMIRDLLRRTKTRESSSQLDEAEQWSLSDS